MNGKIQLISHTQNVFESVYLQLEKNYSMRHYLVMFIALALFVTVYYPIVLFTKLFVTIHDNVVNCALLL